MKKPEKKSGNEASKLISIGLTVVLLFAIGYIVMRSPSPKTQSGAPASNTEIKDGIQYVTIDAKGGYSPRISEVKAGIPTKLIVKTNGTYDCSSSIVINALNYRKILPQTGETEIDIGTGKAGDTLQGLCGMGMYNFQIKFN